MPHLSRIAPEFPATDLGRAIEYYKARLGFHTAMQIEGEYAIVERDDVAIHLYQANGDHTPQSIHIFAEGLDELQRELEQRGTRIKQRILKKPWGNRDFRVLDDSGNELKFTEPLAEG